ncbi:MAG: phosphomannomutase [Rubrimonas sp.]
MKFGTSGLRGLVSDMSDAACAAWTGAFLDHLAATGRAAPRLLVGRDLRPSSPRIAQAVTAAAAARGIAVEDCGALPTPALALEGIARGLPSVMVTGSHIPFDRNGLKFNLATGEIAKADEAGIVAAHDAARSARPAARPGAVTASDAAVARYAARAARFFPAGFLRGRRVGVHQHSAVGRDLTARMLADFGAEVVALGRSDAFIPVDTEAVSEADAAQARAWTAEHGLDALVSTDGDGDRPLVADETGAFLRGDILGALTARYLNADAVATPVSSNTALERSGWFATVRRTRIGSPYVIAAIEALAAEGARLPVAFEANGGFLLGGPVLRDGRTLDPLPTRDAMLPMLAALAMAAEAGQPLSALPRALPARFTASDRLQAFPSDRGAALAARVIADAGTRAALLAAAGLGGEGSVDATDGARVTAGAAIVHLRPSGNAPELRAYAEAGTEAEAKRIVAAALAWAAGALDA